MTVIAFDIETIPNAELLRAALSLPDASDEEVIEKAAQLALEKSDGRSDFLSLAFHKVVAVAMVFRSDNSLHVGSKGPPADDERCIVESFYRLVDKHEPTLVSWNGTGFDLPVLALRAMAHEVVSECYWQGPGDKWNQYTSRFHGAHQDLMDILAHRGSRANTSLQNLALACGLPGKMGYGGSQVLQLYRDEQFSEIRNYCEIDALNTYLLWLRFRLVAGHLAPDKHDEEIALLESYLASSDKAHLGAFHEQWVRDRKGQGT